MRNVPHKGMVVVNCFVPRRVRLTRRIGTYNEQNELWLGKRLSDGREVRVAVGTLWRQG